MTKKIISLLLASVFVLLCLFSCGKAAEQNYYSRTQRNEYGRFSVTLSRLSKEKETLSEEELKAVYNGAVDAFEKAYAFLSTKGNLSHVNNAVNNVFDVDKKLIEQVKGAIKLGSLTEGLYEPCGGSLTALYKTGTAPEKAAVDEALLHVGSDKLTVSDTSVEKTDPLCQVDLYAYADGYALSAAIEYLKKSPVLYGTVTFNGIAGVFGEKPDGEPFLVDISDGTETGKDGSFSVTDGYVALVTKDFGSSYDFSDGFIEADLEKAAVYSADAKTAAVMASVAYAHGSDALLELYKKKELSFEAVLTDKKGNEIYTKNAKDGTLYIPETEAVSED